LALLRGRGHVVLADVRDLAPDVLRHRLVLSYEALGDGMTADQLIEQVVEAVEPTPVPVAAAPATAASG
jgi:MoxR-like ATPase